MASFPRQNRPARLSNTEYFAAIDKRILINMDDSGLHRSGKFPLLRLPAELRLDIYEHWKKCTQGSMSFFISRDRTEYPRQDRDDTRQFFILFRLNRQIRHEALDCFKYIEYETINTIHSSCETATPTGMKEPGLAYWPEQLRDTIFDTHRIYNLRMFVLCKEHWRKRYPVPTEREVERILSADFLRAIPDLERLRIDFVAEGEFHVPPAVFAQDQIEEIKRKIEMHLVGTCEPMQRAPPKVVVRANLPWIYFGAYFD